MKYKVLKDFTDIQDKNRLYRKGEEYPHKDHKPTNERISELASSKNRRGEPMIAEVPAEKAKVAKKE